MNKRRAVIVGINKYQEEEIPELKGPNNDAQEVADLLEKEGDFTIEHLLLNNDATFLAIRQALSDLLWKTHPTDISLFYFSGHGFEDGRGVGYLAPYDMRQAEPFVCGISMSELRQMVIDARNKNRVVGLLDCCYSGLAAQGEKGSPTAPLDIGHQFDNLPQGQGCTILASSGKDQKSREISSPCERAGGKAHEHGIFTFHLLQGLQGKAANAEGHVSLEKLCSHIAKAMTGDDHMPALFQSGVSGETVITVVGRREKIQRLHDEAEALLAKGHVYALFAAIERLGSIKALAPELALVRDLQERLDKEVFRYRSGIGAWILDYQIEIGSRYYDQIDFIRSTQKKLSVDEILMQSRKGKTLLVCLCRMTTEPDAFDDLTAALNEFRNEPSVGAKSSATPAPLVKGATA